MKRRHAPIDRITNLPDSLQTHILSFLTTKAAVHTCTLSTRWRNIWAFVPVLNFDFTEFIPYGCDEFQEYEAKFGHFVYGVLKNRQTSELDTFRLVYEERTWKTYNREVLAKSLLRAVECRPRVIFIDIGKLRLGPRNFFPCWASVWTPVFTCTSLEKMDLLLGDSADFDSEVVRPKSVNLPSLKALKLSHATDTRDSWDNYDFLKKLLAGCPVLEDLILIDCDLGFFEIASNTLKKLVINGSSMIGGIQICCPSLVSLVIESVWTDEISIKNMSSLVEAEIRNFDFDFCDSTDKTKAKLLTEVSSVTSLNLHFDLSQVKELLDEDISNCKTFSKLERLELWQCCSNEGFDMVAWFIHNSPNLKKLTLHLTEPDEDDVEDKDAVEESKGLLLQREHRKMVEIIKCKGANDESVDELIKILHAHVKTIEEIIVI